MEENLGLSSPTYDVGSATTTMLYDNIMHPLLLQVDQYLGYVLIIAGLYMIVSLIHGFFFGYHN